ncbi:MAG: helix-turn-helix transcriptional regulator [bacterium]|nr:helix-turn-helix transcriptional regulator [bacterium]
MSFSERMRLIREELGLSQAEFGTRAGLTQTSISEAETGKREFNFSSLMKISEAYGINLNWLILGLGSIYLKDSQLPFRGDALAIIEAHFPVSEAPGLKALLADTELMRKAQPSAEELDQLARSCKGEFGWMVRGQDKEFWFDMLLQIRQSRVQALQEVRDELKKRLAQPGGQP